MASSQPPPEREARDRGDDRLSARSDPVPGGDEILEISVGEGFPLHLLDVGAGGEGFVGSRDDGAAELRIGLEAIERIIHLAHEVRVQGVEHLWPVELDHADLVTAREHMAFDDDRLIGHVPAPFLNRSVACEEAKASASGKRIDTLETPLFGKSRPNRKLEPFAG